MVEKLSVSELDDIHNLAIVSRFEYPGGARYHLGTAAFMNLKARGLIGLVTDRAGNTGYLLTKVGWQTLEDLTVRRSRISN